MESESDRFFRKFKEVDRLFSKGKFPHASLDLDRYYDIHGRDSGRMTSGNPYENPHYRLEQHFNHGYDRVSSKWGSLSEFVFGAEVRISREFLEYTKQDIKEQVETDLLKGIIREAQRKKHLCIETVYNPDTNSHTVRAELAIVTIEDLEKIKFHKYVIEPDASFHCKEPKKVGVAVVKNTTFKDTLAAINNHTEELRNEFGESDHEEEKEEIKNKLLLLHKAKEAIELLHANGIV